MNPDNDSIDTVGTLAAMLEAVDLGDIAERLFGRELRQREIVRRLAEDPAYIFDLHGEPRPEGIA